MGFCKNDALVVMAFADRGIAPEQIEPRHNVLTFNAWKAKGRRVAKGAVSVKVTTWIPCEDRSKTEDTEDGKKPKSLRPKTACLFHVSQTVAKDAKKGARPDAWQNAALVRAGTYNGNPSPVDGAPAHVANVEAETVESDTIYRPAIVREEVLTLNEQGELVPDIEPDNEIGTSGDDSPAECNCPMAGYVTNVDCPLHGERALVPA
jgi:hypothetical protein